MNMRKSGLHKPVAEIFTAAVMPEEVYTRGPAPGPEGRTPDPQPAQAPAQGPKPASQPSGKRATRPRPRRVPQAQEPLGFAWPAGQDRPGRLVQYFWALIDYFTRRQG